MPAYWILAPFIGIGLILGGFVDNRPVAILGGVVVLAIRFWPRRKPAARLSPAEEQTVLRTLEDQAAPTAGTAARSGVSDGEEPLAVSAGPAAGAQDDTAVWFRAYCSFFRRRSVAAGWEATKDLPVEANMFKVVVFALVNALADALYTLSVSPGGAGEAEYLLSRMEWIAHELRGLMKAVGGRDVDFFVGDIDYAVGEGAPDYIIWYDVGLDGGSLVEHTRLDPGFAIPNEADHDFFMSRGVVALAQLTATECRDRPDRLEMLTKCLEHMVESYRRDPRRLKALDAAVELPLASMRMAGIVEG
jgi:hypothetical protein